MKRNERKKIIPAICVFVFVAFSFVIANTFGDTYAASCPDGYSLTDGQCCPDGAIEYDSAYGGYCVANFVDSSTSKCPDGYQAGNGLNDWYFTCIAEPVEKIDNEPTTTTYTVTLIASGAEIDDYTKVPTVSESDKYYAENISEFDYGKYVASKGSNYEFIGWDRVSACNGPIKSGKMSNEVLSLNPTLYACFTEYTGADTEETSEFEITLNPGDGSWKDGTKDSKRATSVDGKVDLSSYTDDIVSPDGYIFNGWWSENEQKPLNSYADSKNENETLTASFVVDDDGSTDNPPTDPTTYTVNFFDELGDELGTETVNSGETISDFPSFKYPELENFWSDSASCDSGYEFTENIAIVSDLELYQCYSEGFIVEFYDENREYLNEVEVFPVDIVIPEDEIPNLDNGYDGFWSESKMCESKFDVEDEVIVEDTKLYACYIYDIYFYGLDENEEYEKIGSSTFFNGYTLYDVENIPDEDDLLIDGKVFTHWSTSSNSCDENDMLEPEEILPLSLDGVNLYACYTSGEAILVRFNDMNSNKYAEIQVVKGTSINDTVESTGINIPTAPTVEGYTFRFWSNGSNCSKGYNFDNKVEQPLTLTACYNKNATSSGTTDDNVDNNPGTGSFMLYIVFLVGILSLGYTGYSVIKVTKKNS